MQEPVVGMERLRAHVLVPTELPSTGSPPVLDMHPLKHLGFVFLWIKGAKAMDLSRERVHEFHVP